MSCLHISIVYVTVFMLLRFDRLQIWLSWLQCLPHWRPKASHLRSRQDKLLHQWRLEFIADIC